MKGDSYKPVKDFNLIYLEVLNGYKCLDWTLSEYTTLFLYQVLTQSHLLNCQLRSLPSHNQQFIIPSSFFQSQILQFICFRLNTFLMLPAGHDWIACFLVICANEEDEEEVNEDNHKTNYYRDHTENILG